MLAWIKEQAPNTVQDILRNAENLAAQIQQFSQEASEVLIQNAQIAVQDHFVTHITIALLTALIGFLIVEKIKPNMHKPLLSVLSIMACVLVFPQFIFMSAPDMGFLQGIVFLTLISLSACLVYQMQLLSQNNETLLEDDDDHVV